MGSYCSLGSSDIICGFLLTRPVNTQSVRTKGEDLAPCLLGNLLCISLAHIDNVDELLDHLVQLSKNNLSKQ